ncbi:MAG: cobalamin biosynthesis protein CbiN [Peptococcaceae bacterium BRH_c8a]|nr:MAG: cobalamin biosynthesis protein CbiN [Peptococcaceae bacterium BRH_c8a]
MSKNQFNYVNLLLIMLVVLITVFPLVYVKGADFGGADGKAQEAIIELHPEYKPWFNNIWETPSGEVESLLFTLQGAMGAGFVCYYLGYLRGKKSQKECKPDAPN